MGYLIERSRALHGDEVVVVVRGRRRRMHSTVILRDNSLYHTLTRPRTLLRQTRGDDILKGAGWRGQR